MSTRRAASAIELRVVREDDLPFLRGLYAGTREEELAAVPWSEREKADFVDFQFAAQRAHYSKAYPRASELVILCDGAPAGRLYVDRTEAELGIVDISLLKAFSSRGIGTALLEDLIDEARRDSREVVLHVELGNRARRLYERLGFVVSGELGAHLQMRWSPDPPAQAKTSATRTAQAETAQEAGQAETAQAETAQEAGQAETAQAETAQAGTAQPNTAS